MSKTMLITGSNSGIGKCTAEWFVQNGWTVIATMRNTTKAGELSKLPNLYVYELDVTKTESILKAKTLILENHPKIDVIINNAGFGCYGPFELATEDQIDRQLAVNVKGVMMMIKTWLPYFRNKKSGQFINVSSVAGLISYPLASLYISSKWAIEGFTEALFYELKPFNIQVKLVEPGAFKTNFQTSSITWTANPKVTAYDQRTNAYRKVRDKRQAGLPDPNIVAKVIFEACQDQTDRLRYLVGEDAQAAMALRKAKGPDGFIATNYQNFIL